MPVSQRLRDSDRDPHGDAEQLNDRQTRRAEVGAGGGGEGGRGEEYRQMNYRYRCIQLMVRILIIQLSSLYESKGRVYACVMSDRERLSSIIDTC